MVSSIIGRYLLSRKYITSEQLYSLLLEKRKIHVRLGLIAVAEGLMTQAQADEVYNYQSRVDKRFGELAVDKGYLTEWEVESLLEKQGNAYLAFAQALSSQNVMPFEQLELYMEEFQSEYHLTLPDMEDLKSNEVDRILPICIPMVDNQYLHIAGIALRTLVRFVDGELCPKTAYFSGRLEAESGAVVQMDGEQCVSCGIVGKAEAFGLLARILGGEGQAQEDDGALKATGELVSCIAGIYVKSLGQSGVSLEQGPVRCFGEMSTVTAEKILVLPIHVMGEEIRLLIAPGSGMEILTPAQEH